MEITRTAAKNIVDSLDRVRIGLSRYNSVTSGQGGELTVQVADNSAAHRTTLRTAIDAFSPSGNTPLTETLSGIGAYFSKVPTGTTALNLTLHPGKTGQTPTYLNQSTVSAATVFSGDGASLRNGVTGTPTINAPVQYYCQKNFAVLMTDGRPQGDQSISSSLCDYLGIVGSCPTSGTEKYGQKGAANGSGADTGYHVNGNNKQLHIGGVHEYESAGSDYLDDVAAALYEIDLRPDLTKPSGYVGKNNLLTYAIGLADEQAINDPLLQEASAAGGGLFLTAANSAELITAFEKATDDILAKDGSAAAVAVANAHVTNTDNASYATSYNSGIWTGDLIAYPINTTTGIPNTNSPIWNTGCANPTAYVDPTDTTKGVLGCSAQTLLDLKTSATRTVFTNNDTSTCFANCGIPFQPTTASGTSGIDKLSAPQQALLNTPSTTDGAAVLSYLRGDKTGETAGTYRARAHLMGDTVNAEPLVVREPDRNYIDAGYASYKSTKSNRARIIVQPANDGMVHAFNSLTGVEEWAYVPNLLISNSRDPNSSSTSLLNTRTRKVNFNHYFLLDGTPVVGDIDFANSGTVGVTTTDWGTIVVGGLGKGGRGYYALDVTATIPTGVTNSAKESNAATKALWEFPRSITDTDDRNAAFLNMGYSFGKPIIVKTETKGWVVLVSSGYNNGTNSGESGGDGLGHLYVLNAKTGDLIKDIPTTGCNGTPTTHPCGLSSINAYVETKDINNTVEMVYGGDLYGNVWRFNLTGAVGDWGVTKLATLRSGSTGSALQPITTVPELAKITVSGADKYLVYVGTGLYLGKTDLPCPASPPACAWTPNSHSTQTQTMYGLIDARDGSTLPDPLRSHLVAQTHTTSGVTRTVTTNTVNYSTDKGWYIDFTNGERIVTDSALAAGALIFTTNIPSTTACIPGGSSWLFALNYKSGGQIAGSSWGGTSLGSALASRPVLVQLPNGSVKAITRLSDTTTVTTGIPTTSTPAAGRRVSWRELIDK
ncbi:MAG: hypothetical protein A3I66_00895 [Burkholderiales bacterium RIFCSPLOWO2_02_FULL_57_36]|nr:MAG: hypothetical protein A3I66_00895 [Burkholderiales bacterium RIFCSPLOWO2_02_FULL_57_36]